MLQDKKIALFMTGGIASYKAAELSRQLIKKGAHVRVAMTSGAQAFITPLTMQTLTKYPVLTDTFDETDPTLVQHIDLADWADVALVAPATANILSKMANGIGDEIVSTTLLAVHCPRVIAPSMNENMYYNLATQRNLRQLREDGYTLIEPAEGFLAEGYSGKGRLPDLSVIIEAVEDVVAVTKWKKILEGKNVLISAGGTLERVDPVRYISNDSSGKMGYSLAKAAKRLGANVRLVSTRPQLAVPHGVEVEYVESARDMQEAMEGSLAWSDYAVMAAAVSDYRVSHPSEQKIKSDGSDLTIHLTENPDILASLATKKTHDQTIIGFAAETEHVIKYAKGKLHKKKADWIVANDVSQEATGFNTDTNQVTLLSKEGQLIETGLLSKDDVALRIWKIIAEAEEDDSHGA